MFIIPENKINFIKKNGLYEYLLNLEEEGKIDEDAKEEIYQYVLAESINYISDEKYSEFVDGLVELLKLKKRVVEEYDGKE